MMEVFESLDKNDLVGSASTELEAVRRDLDGALAPFDAFDILSNLSLSNTPLNPDTYKETEFEGLIAGVEFAAALLMKRGRHGADADHPPIDAAVLDRINELLKRALRLISFRRLGLLRASMTDGDAVGNAVGSLRHSMATRELFLRNPAYADQEIRTIEGIFQQQQVADVLHEAVGFTAEDALLLVNHLVDGSEAALRKEIIRLQGEAEQIHSLFEAFRRGRTDSPHVLIPLFNALGAVPAKAVRRLITETGLMGFWSRVGDIVSFSAQELVSSTGLPETTVVAFLDWFGVCFAEATMTDWEADARLVRYRPILADARGRYLCTIPSNLLWSVRSRLEEALKPETNPKATSESWIRFERARRRFLEDSSLALIRGATRPVAVHRNLEYNSDGTWYETDGLLIIDSCAIVIEAKGGALTAAARRAAPDSLKRDLKKLIDDGAAQAERLRHLVHDSNELLIRVNGAEVKLDVEEVTHVFSVVVTLEDLGPFAIAMWELQAADIVAGHRDLPWVVSLHNLEIICDLIEFPAQLIHYMIRRRSLNVLTRFRAGDELDLWMYYLATGLYEDETFQGPDAPDVVVLTSQTDDLDAYHLWKAGARSKSAKRPRQRMHARFRQALEHLDKERPHGFLEASVALLNMGDQERRLLASKLMSMQKDSGRNDRFRDMTVQYTGSLGSEDVRYGLTLMTGPLDRLDELETRLNMYCDAKKHQLRADAWFGFAAVNEKTGPFQYYVFGSFPWTPDAGLDLLIQEMGLRDDT